MYNVDEVIFECPVEALYNILCKKWIATIIWELQDNKMNFGEFLKSTEGCTKNANTAVRYVNRK